MYIQKRWLAPATLSLLLLGTFAAVVLLVLGSTVDAKAVPIAQTPPCLNSPSNAVPAAEVSTPATEVPAVGAPSSAGTSPEEVVGISTVGSDDTQINTRGFGDIGMQFQDVNVNAPINIVHISNQGNNNSNNLNIGDDKGIVSDQEQLPSNRSAGSAPVAVASPDATTAAPAGPQSSAGPVTASEALPVAAPTPTATPSP